MKTIRKVKYMNLSVLALITGIVAGGIFTALKLPLPAPPTLPGIMGIIGIFLGAKIIEFFGF
jgi:XapX domain-containing protein